MLEEDFRVLIALLCCAQSHSIVQTGPFHRSLFQLAEGERVTCRLLPSASLSLPRLPSTSRRHWWCLTLARRPRRAASALWRRKTMPSAMAELVRSPSARRPSGGSPTLRLRTSSTRVTGRAAPSVSRTQVEAGTRADLPCPAFSRPDHLARHKLNREPRRLSQLN